MKNFIKPALVLVVLFALCGCSGGQRNEDDLQPPLASPVASGMNYVDVATQFEKAGFSNVQLEGNGELVVGLFHREGDVDEVSIDGKIDYATGDWFPKNSTVIIRFYSFEKASGTLSELQEAEKRKSEQAEKEAAEKERLQAEEEERKAAELAEAEKKAKAEEAEAQAKAQAEEEERKAAEEAKKAEEEKLASYVDQPLRDVYKSLLAEGKNVKLVHEDTLADMTSDVGYVIEHEETQEDTDYIDEWVVRSAKLIDDGQVGLVINSRTNMAEREQADATYAALESKLDPSYAWTAVVAYGEQQYPEGFKLHWWVGKLAEEPRDENSWFLKAYCDATVGGQEFEDLSCEAVVSGTTDSPVVESFTVY